MPLQQPPADSAVLELIPCTILAFPLLPRGESEALSDADIYFASCTLRTCSSEFYSFSTVLSFVRHVSFTSHQQQAASVPQPQGVCSLPTTSGCPPSCQQQCPLAGGTGQKIAPHAKERSLDTLMHPFVSSSLITATPYALK